MFNYRYLFLDWANTLSASHFWEQFRDPHHPHHRIYAHAQTTIFTAAEDSYWLDAWVHGYLTSEQVIEALYPSSAFDSNFVLRTLQESCKHMQFVTPLIPHYLERIRAHGIKVIIATDNMDTFSRWTVPGMQLAAHVDGWLNSADLKCTKLETDALGQSLFFRRFLRANHIRPQESLLLEDNEAAFGTLMQHFGIDYCNIVPDIGLPAELERILAELEIPK